MSCCGGKCGCGGNCNGCAGCKAFPEKAVEGSTASDMLYNEEMSVAGENGCKCAGGCKCGGTCTGNPCNCK
ncbi:hypothetical protein SUGI_0416430 [Cryptomeria japonica]|nr:hypothetical protein SUGI_0416430 [Cryptomeria japonica]